MEALQGWLQGAGGLLEVSGKARQLVTDSHRFVQQQFSTLLDQCQFSTLAKKSQQFLVKLSQEVRNGHLPLEYLIVGGDLRDFFFVVCSIAGNFLDLTCCISQNFLGFICSLASLGDLKVRPLSNYHGTPKISL